MIDENQIDICRKCKYCHKIYIVYRKRSKTVYVCKNDKVYEKYMKFKNVGSFQIKRPRFCPLKRN